VYGKKGVLHNRAAMHLTAFQMGADERDVGSVCGEKGGANLLKGLAPETEGRTSTKVIFCTICVCHTVKKGSRVSRLQPGCH
jgi:hypothetical protein